VFVSSCKLVKPHKMRILKQSATTGLLHASTGRYRITTLYLIRIFCTKSIALHGTAGPPPLKKARSAMSTSEHATPKGRGKASVTEKQKPPDMPGLPTPDRPPPDATRAVPRAAAAAARRCRQPPQWR